MEYKKKEFKSILNLHKYISPWGGWNKYSFSAYQGCEFSCVYCYARSGKYNQHFGDINTCFVKQDAAQMLDKRISNARKLLPDVVCTAGVCDPYQPCEAIFRNTQKCLEVLSKHRWPVHIWTKSEGVLDDLDIIGQIAKDSWATISFSFSTANDQLAKKLEPYATPPSVRLKAITEIKKTAPGIQVGITALPIVPYLSDSNNGIEDLVKSAKDAGADYIFGGPGMTMQNNQALIFLEFLKTNYPDLIKDYEKIYNFTYSEEQYTGEMSPIGKYLNQKAEIFREILDKHCIRWHINRFIPDDYRKINYIVAEKLLIEGIRLQDIGGDWKNIYWAGQNIQNLKESLTTIYSRNELRKIRNVNSEIKKIIISEIKNEDK